MILLLKRLAQAEGEVSLLEILGNPPA